METHGKEEEAVEELLLHSQDHEKQLTPQEEEAIYIAASILMEIKNSEQSEEMDDGGNQLEDAIIVGQAQEKRQRKKRKIKETDDSEETLKLMLEFNRVKPAIPPFVSNNKFEICSEPIRKQLTKSDVDKGQGRLLLGKEEVKKLMIDVAKKSEKVIGGDGLEVRVYGKNKIREGLKVHEMIFKAWNDKNTHVLSTGWNEFVKYYGLKENSDFVTIWMFKHKKTSNFCFAIDCTRFDEIEKPLSDRIIKLAFKNWN